MLFDVTAPVSANLPVWPGDPPVHLELTSDAGQGDPATVTLLQMGSHTGTHVDAFSHFFPDRETLDQMDLARYCGRTLVIEIEDPGNVTLGELQRNPSFLDLRKAERVLFKTVNSQTNWPHHAFREDFCHINPHAASFLVELGVRLVGIDYLSVDAYDAEARYGELVPVHKRLMAAGVYIVEGLYLNGVPPGWYEMAALPMKIAGCDGAPARVILQPALHGHIGQLS